MSSKPYEFLIWSNETVEEIFNELDLNGKNYLSESEIKIALSARGVPVTKTLLNEIFKTCDTSNQGIISRDDFRKFSRSQNKKLKLIFKEMDIKNNNLLSFRDLKNFISNINPEYTDEQIHYMIKKMDYNQNGTIHMEDFINFYHLVPIHNAKMAFDLFSREHIDFGENYAVPCKERSVEDQKAK